MRSSIAGWKLCSGAQADLAGTTPAPGASETRYGIIPDMGAAVRLPRIVGNAREGEMILLAEVGCRAGPCLRRS